MLKHWIGYGVSAFLGAAIGITAVSAIAQAPQHEQYRVVTLPAHYDFGKVEQFLNAGAANGWRLHTHHVVPGAHWVVFERK